MIWPFMARISDMGLSDLLLGLLGRLGFLSPAARTLNALKHKTLALIHEDDLFGEALRLFNQGDYAHSIGVFDELTRKKPMESVYHGLRGQSYYRLGELQRAIADLSDAIRLERNGNLRPYWHNERGLASSTIGDLDRAAADLSVALDAGFTSIDSHLGLANACWQRGDRRRAIVVVSRALALAPNAVGFAGRGMMFHMQGDYKRAVDDFNKAIELNPTEADCYGQRAICYAEMGQYEKAAADANLAIRRDPKSIHAYEARGRVRLNVKDLDSAIADLSSAIDLGSRQSHFFRALAFYAKGDLGSALTDLDQVIDVMPPEATVFSLRGNILESQGDKDSAIADFSKAIELEPQNPDHYASRARLLRETRESRRAIADYSQAIRLAPHADASMLHDWHKSRGFLSDWEGNPDQAIADGDAAIRLAPRDGWGYMIRGMGYRRKGRFDRAITDLSKALELFPNDGGVEHELLLAQRGVKINLSFE
jgi:tetratricopeptide (TPR) repeat protein